MLILKLLDTGPIDGCLPLAGEVVVGLAEVVAPEEAAVGREGRGVGCGEHQVLGLVDECPLGDGVAAPEKEDESRALLAQCLDGGIGEGLPTVALVAASLMGTDGEGGVEEQHALMGPATEVATALGEINTEIGVDLSDDVH